MFRLTEKKKDLLGTRKLNNVSNKWADVRNIRKQQTKIVLIWSKKLFFANPGSAVYEQILSKKAWLE